MSAAGRMLRRRHAVGIWARGVRLLLAALLLVVGAQRAQAQTEVVEYYGQDALGSIRIVFDASGAAIARADYEPFGELFAVPNMPGTSGLPAKQFTGQERDAEASLDYFGARFLAPRTGRFSEIDPVYAGLFDPQQWNRYAYARNNPLSFVDPDGRNYTTSVTCPFSGGTQGCPPIGASFGSHSDWLDQYLMYQFYYNWNSLFDFGPPQNGNVEGTPGSDDPPPPSPVVSDPEPDDCFEGGAGCDGKKGREGLILVPEDDEIVIPGVVGWKTGVPELHVSKARLDRAGRVITGSVFLGYGLAAASALGRPRFVGPGRDWQNYGHGRLFGVVFREGLLTIHYDYDPIRPGGPSIFHLNLVVGKAVNVHIPMPDLYKYLPPWW